MKNIDWSKWISVIALLIGVVLVLVGHWFIALIFMWIIWGGRY